MPDVWHKTYVLGKSLPKYFLTDWLRVKAGLAPEMLDAIDGANPVSGLRRVFGFLTGLCPETWWAPQLHVRLVLVKWLGKQFDAIEGKKRLAALLEAYNEDTHIVDWGSAMPFEVQYSQDPDSWKNEDLEEWPEEKLPYVTHIRHKYSDITVSFHNFVRGPHFSFWFR